MTLSQMEMKLAEELARRRTEHNHPSSVFCGLCEMNSWVVATGEHPRPDDFYCYVNKVACTCTHGPGAHHMSEYGGCGAKNGHDEYCSCDYLRIIPV